MWGKWIGCTVPGAERGRFDSAQRAWAVIGDQEGLVGQVGGWDPDTGHARVLGLWSGAGAHDRFMRERHDAVYAGSRQADSFTGIETAAGETVLEMAGETSDLSRALETAGLLRVADCRLLPGREESFLEVQRRVWGPGMAAAGGMLAGVVTRLAPDRHLVTTLWSGPAAHERYRTEHFPSLLARAGLAHDLRSTAGHLVPLEPAWRVLPTADTP
ncbi:DUF4937 domain-containing protein [Streptomyces sp. NBC_00091]|uniref:DUF4937 domain-containing protein n=1 Tax=Streptomyces sp. NBC_00091 TaxID=2975648 RepID=UPI002252988B|nr:DUF4937 domain-containing protein [Streptomyces sp. NBC_00091]MCX5377802.1 YdbC family protein [Streptomyces sp. NBC_00091]